MALVLAGPLDIVEGCTRGMDPGGTTCAVTDALGRPGKVDMLEMDGTETAVAGIVRTAGLGGGSSRSSHPI